MTYKQVLVAHVGYGWFENFRQVAINVGYPYFLWNDRVYDTYTGSDTGKTASDIK